jgi:O-antigen/teichoic acid export membrane protein
MKHQEKAARKINYYSLATSAVKKNKPQFHLLLKGGNHNFNTLIFLLVVNVLIAAIGFVTRIKMANVLGTVNFGILSYGIAIAAYIETIVRYGTDKTLVRDIVQQEDRTAEIVTVTLLLKLLLFFICICLLLIYLKTAQNEKSDLVLWVIIGSSLIAFEAKGAYDATSNIRRHSFYFAGFRLIYFFFIWLSILTNANILTVEYVGIMMAISGCIYMAVQYKWLFSKYRKKIKLKSINNGIWKLLKSNSFICFAAICGLGLTSFNQVILKKHCGAEELGIYAAAWQFFWVGNLFILQLSRVGQPILARKLQVDEINNATHFSFVFKYVAVMVVAILPIALPMIIFPDLILSTFFSQEYSQSITPLRIIGFYLMVISVGVVFSQYIIISRKDKLYMVIVLIFGAIGMLFSWFMVPKYQAKGAAISLILTHGLAICVFVIFVLQDLIKSKKLITI